MYALAHGILEFNRIFSFAVGVVLSFSRISLRPTALYFLEGFMIDDKLTIEEIVAILKAQLDKNEPIDLEMMHRLEDMRRTQ